MYVCECFYMGPIIDCCIIYVICRQFFYGTPYSSAPPTERCGVVCVCVPFAEFQIKRCTANHSANALPRTINAATANASTESGSAVGAVSQNHIKATTTTKVPYFSASLLTFLTSHILYFIHFRRRVVRVCTCMCGGKCEGRQAYVLLLS